MATDAAKVRTIAITGQGHSGKTSVADALVFAAGGNNRPGRVDEESSVFDTEPEGWGPRRRPVRLGGDGL